MQSKPDHYAVLGVDRKATLDEIKKAYRQIAMTCHPDRTKSLPEGERQEKAERFNLAAQANEVLTNTKLREVYDLHGHEGVERVKNGEKISTDGFASRARAGSPSPRFDLDDLEAYFGMSDQDDNRPPAAAPVDKAASDERRRRRREDLRHRMRNGERPGVFGFESRRDEKPAAQKPPPPPSSSSSSSSSEKPSAETKDFSGLVSASEAFTRALRSAAAAGIPHEVVEDMRDALRAMAAALDEAVQRAHKRSGPGR